MLNGLTEAAISAMSEPLWAQFGVLGMVVGILLVFARMAIKRELERSDLALAREVERCERLEKEVARLNGVIQDKLQEKVLPALTTATRAVEESQVLLTAFQRERQEARIKARRDND